MSNKEILNQEYQGFLETLKLSDYKGNKHNIIDQHVQFVYVESMSNCAVAGHLFLVDTVDYPTLLPMIGEETIEVSFSRPEPATKDNKLLGGKIPSIKFEYPIFKLEGKNQTGGSRKRQTYTLHYCSDLPFINLNTRVYKSFKNMKYSEMVQRIYDEYIKQDGVKYKPLNIEETKNSGDFEFMNMNPLAATHKIAARSISKDGNGYLYVFYEDRDAYNFVTIQSLMKKKPTISLSSQLKNISKDHSGSLLKNRDLESQIYNTDNYRRENIFNTLNSAMLGEGTSSLLTIDPLIRKYYYNEFDLRGADNTGEDYWKKFPHLGDKKPWTDKNKMFVTPKQNMAYGLTSFETTTQAYFSKHSYEKPPHLPEDYFLHKKSLIYQFDRNTITTTISGDPRLKVGDVLTLCK